LYEGRLEGDKTHQIQEKPTFCIHVKQDASNMYTAVQRTFIRRRLVKKFTKHSHFSIRSVYLFFLSLPYRDNLLHCIALVSVFQ